MKALDERVKQRRALFERYYEAFGHVEGIEFQPELEETISNRWLTALTINSEVTGVSRHEIIERLNEANIEARPVWQPMHLQPLFDGVKYYPHEEGNSVSDYLFEYGLCLSSGSNMSGQEQERVIGLIKGKRQINQQQAA